MWKKCGNGCCCCCFCSCVADSVVLHRSGGGVSFGRGGKIVRLLHVTFLLASCLDSVSSFQLSCCRCCLQGYEVSQAVIGCEATDGRICFHLELFLLRRSELSADIDDWLELLNKGRILGCYSDHVAHIVLVLKLVYASSAKTRSNFVVCWPCVNSCIITTAAH